MPTGPASPDALAYDEQMYALAVLMLMGCGRVGFDLGHSSDASGGDASETDAALGDGTAGLDPRPRTTPSLKQVAVNDSPTATVVTSALPQPVTAGDLLVVQVTVDRDATPVDIVSMTDTLGFNFTTDTPLTDGGLWRTWLFSAPVTAAGDESVTLTVSAANANAMLWVHELENVEAFDHGSATTGTFTNDGDSVESASTQTTTTSSLVLNVVISAIVTPDASYQVASQYLQDVSQYKIVPQPAAVTAVVQLSGVGLGVTSFAANTGVYRGRLQ